MKTNTTGAIMSVEGGTGSTASATLTVNAATATTTTAGSGGSFTYGQTVNLSATVTVTAGGAPVTTGTMTFFDSTIGQNIATGVALNSSGVASTTTSTLTAGGLGGVHIIDTIYVPGGGFAASSDNLTVSISKATLTVTAQNAFMPVGGTVPTFTAQYTNFVNSENSSVLSGLPSLTTTATSASPVGTYTITAAMGTLSATNYSFSFVNGTLTVVAYPTVSNSFGAPIIPLGGATSLSFTITNPSANVIPLTGIAFSDTLPSGLVVATPNGLTSTCTGTQLASVSTTAISSSGVTLASGASCTFSVNVKDSNAGVKSNTTGAITSNESGTGAASNTASVTVAVAPGPGIAFGAASIPFNTSTSLTFTLSNSNPTVGLTGIGISDTLPAGLTVSTPNGLTGTCLTTAGGVTAGSVTAVAGSGTVSIASLGLAATTSCTFAVNVTGTALGSQSDTTGNVTSNESGTGGTASASVTVTQATQTITFGSLPAHTYGDAPFSVAATADSGLTVTFASTTTGVCTVSGTTVTIRSAGSCSITASQAGNSNYSAATNVIQAFPVNPATLTVTANASRPFGSANPVFSTTITGFVNGDVQSAVVTGAALLNTAATVSSLPGAYPITVAPGTLATNSNYIFNFVNGTLTITNVSLTVTPSGGTRAYGAANSLSYTITGFVGSDTIAVVSGAPALSGASPNSPPGTYTVTATQGTLAATNYTFTFVSGSMTVVKAATGVGVNGITPGITASPGQSFVVSFIVAGAVGAAAPTGAMSYTVDGGAAQTATLNNGTATVTFAGLAVGAHAVLNSYGGDGNYLATTPAPLTLTIMKASSQLKVSISPGNTVLQGQNFTLNFTAAGTGATAAPTGTVSCTVDGGATPQTATLTAGSASLTLAGLAVGTHTVACTYGGDTNYPAAAAASITLTVQQAAPAINAGGVVSAAGTNGGVSPGGLMSLFGNNLQGSTSSGAANALAEPLPITLGGTQVLVNGVSAPLLYVAPGQINCQAPHETPVGTPVQLAVVTNGISSLPLMVTFSTYAPTVFLYPRTATSTDPVITHANGTLVTPTSPAQPGEVLVIYGTGAGKLNNQPLDGAGAPTSPPATTVATPTVTLGGAAVTVSFSGLAPGFVGLLQINIQMPVVFPATTSTPPSLPLVITFPGGVSAPVNLWVQ